MIDLNTIVIVAGLFANAAAIIGHFIRLERRFTKIESFLEYKFGYNDGSAKHEK